MLFETSTIASVLPMVIEAMQKNYNFDARPIIADLGIDLSRIEVPGARYPTTMMISLAETLREKTGDDCIGLAIGVGTFDPRRSMHSVMRGWPAPLCSGRSSAWRVTTGLPRQRM